MSQEVMCAALVGVVRPEDECSFRDDSIDSWAHIAGHIEEVDKHNVHHNLLVMPSFILLNI